MTARSVELDLVPEGRADVNALGFARAFDDPAFRGQVVAQVAARGLRAGERVAFPAVLGIADPHGVGGARARARPSRLRGSDAAAVGAGHAALRHPARGVAPGGRHRRAQQRGRRRRARRPAGARAARPGRPARGAARRRLRVPRDGRLLRPAAWSSTRAGPPARPRSDCPVTGVPDAGEERFRPGYFEDHPIGRAGVIGGPRAAPARRGRGAGAGERSGRRRDAGRRRAVEGGKSGDGLSLATGHRAAELVLAASTTAAGAPAAAARS